MNLQIGTVLSCTDDGCQVQSIDSGVITTTRYSAAIVKYRIPIRANQFVIIDTTTTPPETIFRWRRAIVTAVVGDRVDLDDQGQRLSAAGGPHSADLKPGDEVMLKGYNDENRQVIDLVVDGKPAHAMALAAA